MALRTKATHKVHSYVQNVGSNVHQLHSNASEAAAPASLTPPLSVSESKGPKKPTRKYTRTIFTNQQLVELEREFQLDRFLNRSRRITIAERLSLRERQVKLWFQNRRMKHKKIALKTENITSAHQPSIGSLNCTPTATASNTHLLVDKTPSLQLSTDQPPQRKLITFADTQRAVQEFLEYAEKLRKLQASNQQPNSLPAVVTAVKSENTAQTFEGNSTINVQPISPPGSPTRLGNNACDNIDLGFLDHCQEPDLMAWNCSPISQETLSPPFDMDLDYLNNLLNL